MRCGEKALNAARVSALGDKVRKRCGERRGRGRQPSAPPRAGTEGCLSPLNEIYKERLPTCRACETARASGRARVGARAGGTTGDAVAALWVRATTHGVVGHTRGELVAEHPP